MDENQCAQGICTRPSVRTSTARHSASEGFVTRSSGRTSLAEVSASMVDSDQQKRNSGIAAPAFEIEEKLYELYERRLVEINEQASGDASLKEITYKEWIAMLRQINRTLINNIQEMDSETTKRLALLQKKSKTNCSCRQAEVCKYRNDRDNLIRLIRNAKQNGVWDLTGLTFETITPEDIFGGGDDFQSDNLNESGEDKAFSSKNLKECVDQKSKLMTHLKSLAMEIADRHDEMRDLKRQVISLEDDILNAQKKIQLKDDVIRELRNDLKTFPKSAVNWGRRVSEGLSPVDCLPLPTMTSEGKISDTSELETLDTPRANYSKNRDSINSINLSDFSFPFQDDEDEECLIRQLKDELSQFIEMQQCYEKNVGYQKRELKDLQPRINQVVDRLVKTNHDQQRKLRFYRRELLNLENPQACYSTDHDSGISADVEPDARIVNAVRSRMSCLLTENRRLQQEDHHLRVEKEDVMSQLTAKSSLLDKTSRALREVADIISMTICKPINYEEIFRPCSTCNPIVEAFGELLDSLKERDKLIMDLRAKITQTVKTNDDLQTNTDNLQDQLCELKNSIGMQEQYQNRGGSLFQNQGFSRSLFEKAEPYRVKSSDNTPHRHQTNHNEYSRIIDELSSDLNTLSCQVNMVHKELLNDECADRFENTLKILEDQSELLQRAIDNLTDEKETLERALQTENEELKNEVCCLEEKISYMQTKIDSLQRQYCDRCEANKNRVSPERVRLEDCVQKLEFELKWQCKEADSLRAENNELRQELSDVRKSRAKEKLKQRRDSNSDSSRAQDQKVQELVQQLNAIQAKYDEQHKALRRATRQIEALQAECEDLHLNAEVQEKERLLLNSELTALKECQASRMGTDQSLRNQLQRTTDELYRTREKLSQVFKEKNRLEHCHRCETKRMQEKINEVVETHNNLIEEYNKVVHEYQKLVQSDEEKDKIICAFEEWKRNQIEADRDMQKKKRLLEDHIEDMLKNQVHLLSRLEETENVNMMLKDTLEHSRINTPGNRSGNISGSMRGQRDSSASSHNDPVSKVIANIRHTARRMSQQRSMIQDESVIIHK